MRVILAVLLSACFSPSAHAQRTYATGDVTFYAAPNGQDADNDCLTRSSPCTPLGAHIQALTKWDFNRRGCYIRLAPGTYTSAVSISAQYVGVHLCHLIGPHDAQGICSNPQAATFVGAGLFFQDGSMASITCLTVSSADVGYGLRQVGVLDLDKIGCINVQICVQAGGGGTTINQISDLFVMGGFVVIYSASDGGIIRQGGGSRLVADSYIGVSHLVSVEKLGQVQLPSTYVGGAFSSTCSIGAGGFVFANGGSPPCTVANNGGWYFP